jgi:hypothetical protein
VEEWIDLRGRLKVSIRKLAGFVRKRRRAGEQLFQLRPSFVAHLFSRGLLEKSHSKTHPETLHVGSCVIKPVERAKCQVREYESL